MPKARTQTNVLSITGSPPAIQDRPHIWKLTEDGVDHMYGSGWTAFYHFRPTYPDGENYNEEDEFGWDCPPRTILPDDPRDLPPYWEQHMPSGNDSSDDDDDGYFGFGGDNYY